MDKKECWLQWAIELQSLAQIGLNYCKDIYDKERYQRIRDISAEIVSFMTDIPNMKVKDLFAMKVVIRHQNLTPEPPFLKMKKFFLYMKMTANGLYPEDGWM